MEKQVIRADVPENGGAYNLCIRYGDMLYLSGLAPFEAEYCAAVAAARAAGAPVPPMPDTPFERQCEIVMEHIKRLVEAAGSNMDCLIKNMPQDDPVYRFMDKKRTEGKPYYVYMTAGANKFLRIYYARVKECMAKLETPAEIAEENG